MEKISIIVPVYNVESYLQRCINSILQQTYTNLEIILIDDGSSDNSGNICDAYSNEDNRIKVIHKINGGLSSARNVGIDASTSNYIVFVDSDDLILPHMVESLYLGLINNNCSISQCNYFRFSDNIMDESVTNHYQIINKEVALNNIDSANYMAVWNKMYLRELFDNIRFPEGKIHEDVGTTYKLFYLAQRIAVTNDKLYGYFQNPNSITTSKIKLNKLDLIEIYEEQAQFFKRHSLSKYYFRTMNNLAALFGTLCSYPKERYLNYDMFFGELSKRYKSKWYRIFLTVPLRFDLKAIVLMSFGNLKIVRLFGILKNKRKRAK